VWNTAVSFSRAIGLGLGLGLALVPATSGCQAQTAPELNAETARRIEVLVRSQFGVPTDYDVKVGRPEPGKLSGYRTLPVTLSRSGRTSVVNFLLSNDGRTLARMETFDLLKDPALAIPIEGRPMRGNPDAIVTIINFDDLECPYCARMHAQLFPATMDRYGDRIRIVYKDYPLSEIHPWAMHAAVDANCLAAQKGSAYWSYVDYVHSHGQQISGEQHDPAHAGAALDEAARAPGAENKLDLVRLNACLARQDTTAVEASLHEGEALRIDGTPVLFINGERIPGALPVEQVWMAIDRALAAAGVPPPPPAATPATPATPVTPPAPAAGAQR
jgi:protein-disulfide isomerase